MWNKWSEDYLVLRGATESETRLLQALLEDRGLRVVHANELDAAMFGLTRSRRFAIRREDAAAAEAILQAEGLGLEDFCAVPGDR
ncbi:MAG TPA: hypothetical protein PLY66_02340 [Acidobacteriota bacterium]|nr:hypothetical protein [Acidobacteriota bacterium]HOS99818.1 hypothetical protein [Acidobacteriota bacterium]HQF87913.1 hypothetical protein [Acidobacteriota bacterium]HQG92277.1 hypothetical protein [Acidobacteriota bacterium]